MLKDYLELDHVKLILSDDLKGSDLLGIRIFKKLYQKPCDGNRPITFVNYLIENWSQLGLGMIFTIGIASIVEIQ